MLTPVSSRVATPINLSAAAGGDGTRMVHVVIETVRGGRNKLAYDEKLGLFRLKKVLPEGMAFPCDFGFVPSTRGGDGDPLDALVLMDAPGTTGCLLDCRLIGVILGEQEENGKRERNDRLLAVALPSHRHGGVASTDDLDPNLLRQLGTFFVNYHAAYGETFRVLGCDGPAAAWKLVEEGERAWKHEGDHRER
jgi:inorganic pyrophosphatase